MLLTIRLRGGEKTIDMNDEPIHWCGRPAGGRATQSMKAALPSILFDIQSIHLLASSQFPPGSDLFHLN